jgi:DNA polymerase-3 subunit chi
MSRVDFYILPENSSRDRFACSIASKAWQSGNSVYIHTSSRENAIMLDDLLWVYQDISFVPHTLADPFAPPDAPVIIGWQEPAPANCDVLINLTANIPAIAAGFARIVEIVAGSEEERAVARNRYRGYRDSGHELHNHDIKGDYD